jgi:cystathionine beta-synthase
MRSNGFLDEADTEGTVAHILKLRRQELITGRASTSVRDAIGIMKQHGISQLPVLDDNGRHVGIVAEIDLLNWLVEHEGELDTHISELVESDYATVSPHTRIALLRNIFKDAKVVLVTERDQLMGVLTKIDLIDYLATHQV